MGTGRWGRAWWLVVLGSLLAVPPRRAETAEPWGGPALVVTGARSNAELRELAVALERQGARLPIFLPPDALIGDLPPGLDPERDPALAGRLLVARQPDETRALLARERGRRSALAGPLARWAGVHAALHAGRPVGRGSPLAGDAIEAREAEAAERGDRDEALPCAQAGWTSQYMLGDVSIGILLMESVNPAENSETWSVARQDEVVAEVIASGGELSAAYPEAGLDFFIEVSRDVPTQVEPIAHAASERGVWIGHALAWLGQPGVGTYVRDLRARHGTDWATAAFVVDSRNDSDGTFTDGLFAFAFIGGPSMVMTYDNDGWGIGGMDTVFAHELGHNFLALDEYASAGQPCDRRSGVLSVENQNSAVGGCLGSDACLMRANRFPTAYCSWSEGQLGLRDSDLDGVADLREQLPQSAIDPLVPNPTPLRDLTLTGSATALPDPADRPWLSAHTLNELSAVEYRLDGGGWLAASASDGAFDQLCEGFSFDLTGLSEGWHDIETRAVANACDPADVDVCSPPRTRVESSPARLRVYVNSDCAEDALEPNDAIGEEVAIGRGTTGSLQLCAYDPDLYRVFLRSGGNLDVRAEYTTATAAVELVLEAPDGSVVAQAAGVAGVATVSVASALATGWYRIVFRGIDDAETAYRLVLAGSCVDDPFEPNPAPADGPALAAGLTSLLQICPSDDDWYRLSVSEGADVAVELRHAAALGDLDLELLAPDLSLVGRSATGADLERIDAPGLVQGVYFVHVVGASPAAENTYDLWLASSRCLDDLAENDDLPASAGPAIGRFTGRVCGADADWRRLDLARPSLLRATLGYAPASAGLELELRDAAGVVLERGSGAGGLLRIARDRLDAGTYFLRLASPGGLDADYSLEAVAQDPVVLLMVKRSDDAVLDWSDAGVDCYWIRRAEQKQTFDGGFERVLDLVTTPSGEAGHDATSWADAGVVPDGILHFYGVFPTACASQALEATKTADPYPVYPSDATVLVPIRFTITVRNQGREPVLGVRVVDDLPPLTLSFRVISIPPGATDTSNPSGGRFGRGQLVVTGFDLAPETEAEVVFEILTGPGVGTNSPVLRNQGQVSAVAQSGVAIDTLTDDPSTHAPLDSTDLISPSKAYALRVHTFWNQDINLDLRVVDPCGNLIGPADLPRVDCPAGIPGGSVSPPGACGVAWPWGWYEGIGWFGTTPPASGDYQVFLRYSGSRDQDPTCRHGGIEDAVVVIEKGGDATWHWLVLDPASTDWLPVATVSFP